MNGFGAPQETPAPRPLPWEDTGGRRRPEGGLSPDTGSAGSVVLGVPSQPPGTMTNKCLWLFVPAAGSD